MYQFNIEENKENKRTKTITCYDSEIYCAL